MSGAMNRYDLAIFDFDGTLADSAAWFRSTINQEVGIQRQNGVPLVNLGHPHNARIGKRHRDVLVLLKQPAQLADVLINPEGNAECAVVDKVEDGALRL